MAYDVGTAKSAADYYKNVFMNNFRDMEGDTFYPRVTTPVPSNRESELHAVVGDVPGFAEYLGDRQLKEIRAGDYRLTNKHWENSIRIDKNKLADDVHGFYDATVGRLAEEAAFHPDELLIDVMVAGESTVAWDGQFFFDTDHTFPPTASGSPAAQSNDLTQDIANPAAPTATEFKTSYNLARIAMMQFKNDQGKFINRTTLTKQKNLLVFVPPEHQQSAEEALLTTTFFNSGDQNIVLDRPTVIASPLLTTNTKWYLFNVGTSIKPFVWQTRKPVSVDTKGEDDAFVKDVFFGADARYNVGYLNWQAAIVTTFT